jgi:putative (di)nucleoside polyphosphate hydrolase
MFRELREEIGLLPEHVTVLGVTKGWLRYRLPAKYVRKNESPICIGQKQKWFLLRLDAPDDAVRLDIDKKPEFRDWQWVSYWYPISSVVDFKQQVYRSALSELMSFNLPKGNTRRRRRKR